MNDQLLMTESSYLELQQKLEHFKKVKRAEMAEALRKARSYGDLSENFEYHAARRDQGILNGQIAEMEKQLEIATVVPDSNVVTGTIGLGSTVVLREISTSDDWEFTLVDAVKANPLEDRISVQSPVGQAVLNRRAGDTVEVQTPGGLDSYEIVDVR
jgi:transcription elongation factor GreA